jgi:protein-S-isoprenylcysteine O-methyltransferase Ste14
MFIRALAAFLVLPGMVAFAVPILIAQLDPWRSHQSFFGLALLHSGVFLLFWCIRDFYVAGRGTLAPWDPPQRLVTVGLYRYSRNPMYIAVLVIVAGWAAYFGSWLLMAYALLLAVIFYLRVVLYEEPWLQKTYTTDWQRYQRNVPRWLRS